MTQRLFFCLCLFVSVEMFGMDADERAYLERVSKLPSDIVTTRIPLSTMAQPDSSVRVVLENCELITAAEALRLLLEDDRQRNRSAIGMFGQAGSGE